jgi:hypothetical protein
MKEQTLAQHNHRVSLKPSKSRAALTITHPNAAGIDIGNTSHFVSGNTSRLAVERRRLICWPIQRNHSPQPRSRPSNATSDTSAKPPTRTRCAVSRSEHPSTK